mgnify:CR=1 FL=1
MGDNAQAEIARVAESYYDSDDADRFYFKIWGGEDIHIGLYQGDSEPIADASRRTVATMADRLSGLDADSRAIDLGAGYGGAARYLADRFGCDVVCLNISEVQNRLDRELNEKAGLADKVEVRHGSFEDVPYPDGSFDAVWSQDAFLHSGARETVVAEIARVLAPGGEVVFTDPMQADDCPEGVLQPVYDRLQLSSLGSPAFYRKAFAAHGIEEVSVDLRTDQLRTHYDRVRQELEGRYDDMTRDISKAYADKMIEGLKSWVKAADAGHLAWGILHFRKR